jgi:hypothetical protein
MRAFDFPAACGAAAAFRLRRLIGLARHMRRITSRAGLAIGGLLMLEFLSLRPIVGPGILGLRSQHCPESVADTFVVDPPRDEGLEDLAIKLRFRDPDTRVYRLVVFGASVIEVFPSGLGLLDLQFGNLVPTMTALDEV